MFIITRDYMGSIMYRTSAGKWSANPEHAHKMLLSAAIELVIDLNAAWINSAYLFSIEPA